MSWNQSGNSWGASNQGGNSWGAAAPAGNSWSAPAAAAPAANSWQGGGGQQQSGGWGQQQAAAPAQQSWNAPAKPAAAKGLNVSGCSHPTIGAIVRGDFSVASENHSKPVFKKSSQVSGLDVMIYFWDTRDGPSQAGWWFGPKVGGEQVWAYNPDQSSAIPPRSGWQVPYGAPVDQSFTVSESGGAAPAAANSWSQPAQQQQSWNKPAQAAPQQQGWGQQAQAAPAKGGWGQQSQQQNGSSWDSTPAQAAPEQQGWGNQSWGQGNQAQAWEDPKVAEMKRRQEENKAKLEEARLKQQAEAAARQQQMAKLQAEAARKKAEDQAKLQAMIAQKKVLEEQKRVESKATFAIRAAIQKVRVANAETIDAAEAALGEAVALEMGNCGLQAEKLQQEVDLGLTQAKTRIEQVAEERKKLEAAKIEAERLRKEHAEKAKAIVVELEGLVETCDKEGENLKEMVKVLDGELSSAELGPACEKVEEGEAACKAAAKACMDYVKQESAAMKESSTEMETKQACAKLLKRIQEGQLAAEATMNTFKEAKEKVARKAKAQETTQAMEKIFKKYDKDSDKALSQKEVAAYASGEFKAKLDKPTLDFITMSLVEDGAKGVKVEQLPRIASIVGVTRELARDKARLAFRLEKEKVIGGLRDSCKAKVAAVSKSVEAADKAVSKVEEEAANLMKKARVLDDLESHCDKIDKVLKTVTVSYDKAKKQMEGIVQGLDPKYEKDLKEFLADEAKRPSMDMGRMEKRIDRVKVISSRFRGQAKEREGAALEELKVKVMKVVRFHQQSQDLSADGLFELFATDKANVTKKDWLAFFASADMEVRPYTKIIESEEEPKAEEEKKEEEKTEEKKEGDEAAEDKKDEPAEEKKEEVKPEKKEEALPATEKIELSKDELAQVFAYYDAESTGSISKDSFVEAVCKRYMRVKKETAMTSEMGIVGCKSLRKLSVHEVVEVISGPMRDASMKVARIQCKALKDGVEGWVSIAGNAGTKFLEDGGNLFKVIRKVAMTDDFETNGDASDNTLNPGSVLEVLEFPRKDEAGATRIKGRARARFLVGELAGEKKIGWVTTESVKEGKVFCRAL